MKVRTRISLLQWTITGVVLLMACVAYVSISTTRYYMQRMQLADRQLEAITSVAMHANRYSEQIAELLLVGEHERADFIGARGELEASFDRLERATHSEASSLSGERRRDDTRDELFRIQRMRELRSATERSVARMMQLREQGRIAESTTLFQREIEERLDAEFEHLLAAALLDEQEEVDAAERQVEALWRRLLWTIVLTTLAALAVCVAVARKLARALILPVARLTAGTEAIRQGDLAHRITSDGDDELGQLARRFNEMAGQLDRQQALVAEAQSQLERQVVERTRELAVANQRLTDTDRLRVQFLADISHELRTPLTALRGEAEVSLRHEGHSSAIYRDALVRIVGLARDMGRMVDDLLFLARSETDTLRFVMQRVALHELLVQVASEGTALGRARSVEVQFEPVAAGEPPLWVMADRQRLRQGLMIVIDNAIKYSQPGQRVELHATRIEGGVEVTVSDHGRGIRAEDLPHVFDRYYRGLAPGSAGTGLGLAIARWLVEKHDGDIVLNSEPGRGTRVRIRLPLASARP